MKDRFPAFKEEVAKALKLRNQKMRNAELNRIAIHYGKSRKFINQFIEESERVGEEAKKTRFTLHELLSLEDAENSAENNG